MKNNKKQAYSQNKLRIISGFKRGLKLEVVDNFEETRPISDRGKTTLFNIIDHNKNVPSYKGKKVCDVFSGTGSVGLEFVSRGCEKCDFFEKSKITLECLKINMGKFEGYDFDVFNDALNPNSNVEYDFIYFDPPYTQDIAEKAVNAFVNNKNFTKNTMGIIRIPPNNKFEFDCDVILEKIEGYSKFIFFKLK